MLNKVSRFIIYNMFKFSFRRFLNSFKFAFRGLRVILEEEQSFLVQILVAATVIFLMFYFDLPAIEKVVLIIVINLILILEIINTAIERVLDIIEPNFDSRVGKVKDLVSAIVLFASLGAVVVGSIIFTPYFRVFWRI